MFYIIQVCWCSPGSRASFADDTGDDGASFKPQLEARLSCRLSHFPPNVKNAIEKSCKSFARKICSNYGSS